MTLRGAIGALAACGIAAAACAEDNFETVYAQDFESSVGAEWSSTVTGATAGFTRFLGRFSNATLRLTLGGVEIGALHTFSFDFLAIDSWDGDDERWGRDVMGLRMNGETIFEESFSNTPSFAQSYEGTPDVRWVDLGFGTANDAIYREMSFEFVAESSTMTFDFFAQGLQHIDDESWGIDNVALRKLAVPGPATGAAALLGLAAMGRRRR